MPLTLPIRSSAGAWLAPVIVLLMTVWALGDLGTPMASGYWTGSVARAGDGLVVALPLSAAIAAWEAARFRQVRLSMLVPARRSGLRIVLSQLGPVLTALVIGYALMFCIDLLQSGIARAGTPNFSPLVVFAAATAFALSAGYVLGLVLPSAVAVPLALIGLFQWATYPQTDGYDVAWRHITGYAAYNCCGTIYDTLDSRAILAPVLPAAGAMLFALLLLRVRAVGRVLAVGGLGIVALAVAAVPLTRGADAYARSERSASEWQCDRGTPVICLWPEQAASDSLTPVRAAVSEVRDSGLALPDRVVAAAPESRLVGDDLGVFMAAAPTSSEVARAVGAGFVAHYGCEDSWGSAESVFAADRAAFAVGVLAGGVPVEIAPQQVTGGDASQAGELISPSEAVELLDLPDRDSAVAYAVRWVEDQRTVCRARTER